MKFTVNHIAHLLGAHIEGDAAVEIEQLAKIETALPGSLTFLANPKYEPYLYQTQASAVIVHQDFVPQQAVSATLLRVADPYAAFTRLLEEITPSASTPPAGIDPLAYVSPEAHLGQGVSVGAFAYIAAGAVIGDGACIYPQVYVGDRAKVGARTVIYPQVSIYHGCEVGEDCILHAGCRIGSDGFGFAPQPDGSFKKIPQTGNVVLENEVEVGANTCIDRATLGHTRIGRGVKLDNLVQIAHNVEINPYTVVAAQAGIAGSTHLGSGCMIGGQAGIVGHLRIADRTLIDAQSGVNRSIKQAGQAFRGSPVQPHRQQLKSEVMFRKLEDMYRRIQALEAALTQRD
jgi:UDP-3-O-[3-hydroxymyristoyl] glucosamine N-acyltransferase